MNRSDNQSDRDPVDDEAFDLDDLLDDAFAARRVPVLSPSLMDVRRRARHRRNRTRATGLAAAACVSVGGVAVLLNNHRPAPRTAVGADELGDEQPCVPPTTVLVNYPPITPPYNSSSAPPLTYLDTTTLSPTTTALATGFVAAATNTSTTDIGVVTPSTTCAPQPRSGFRCIGEPTAMQDGWTYYDYCETVGDAAPPSYAVTTLPPPTAPATTVPVLSATEGDTLQGSVRSSV
jgi:hypothetical protein